MFSAVSNPVADPGRERRRGIDSRAETHKVLGHTLTSRLIPFDRTAYALDDDP